MKRLLLAFFAGLLLNAFVFAQWDNDYYYDEPEADVLINVAGGEGGDADSQSMYKLPTQQPINIYFYNTLQPPPEQEARNIPPPAVQQEVSVPDDKTAEHKAALEKAGRRAAERRIAEERAERRAAEERACEERIAQRRAAEESAYEERVARRKAAEETAAERRIAEEKLMDVEQRSAPAAAGKARIIPVMPDPNSSMIYCLQVGAYSTRNTADRIARNLRAAGLQADIEKHDSLQRVFVPGVRARDVSSTVRKLEALGVEEIWIRE